ncbi:MAG: protein kinase domain-containing protein [Burkholderiales bacterium]|jgi:serine/threonine protein kinase|nr:serine/threonine-protein kinase [Nitrosomonadaceae bacterium]
MNITRPIRIGKYEVLSELGRGATAVVYLAEDTFNDRKVAIKVQVKDESAGPEEARRFEKLFLNEAAMVGKLSHPNIVGVYDAVVDGEQQYIVMEYVGGGSLKKFCSETNLLPLRQAVLVVFKACRALDYAFQNGVIHRDIKPQNILLSDRDDIKISDFGTAQISQATHTQIDGFVGSPAYMAPEQINEEPSSVQTDIYSLGVTMYELLTGRLPFQAANYVAMINKVLNEEPTPIKLIRPDLPDALVRIVEMAMAKDPAKRYPAWYAMARDLADTFPQLEKYSFEISSAEKFNALRRLEFFKDFRDSELWEVLRGALWETHGREENLLLEGDAGHAFFIIVSGQVKVMKDGKLLNVLKEGDCFGEMAYLSGDRARRTASISAVSEVQLLKVQDVQLENLSDACQLRFNRVFLRTLIERLAWTSGVLAQVKQ